MAMPDAITCITPPASAEGTYDVVVTVGSAATSYSGYTYDSSSTPTVSSLMPTISPSPKGGSNLTISGTAFGTTMGSVTICGKECPIVSWTDIDIVCTLPPNTQAECKPRITIPGNGFADVSGVSPVTYNFKVTSISPMMGSVLGGTTVSIDGLGFTNDECNDIKIMFGDSYNCMIEMCTDSFIQCKTERITKTVEVRNTGSHAIYGYGYKWNPVMAKVSPGDTVEWRWTLGSASLDSGINIFQTPNSGSVQYDGSGFHSGPKALEGYFSQTFEGVDVVTYASDSVIGEDSDIHILGSVDICLPTDVDQYEDLHLMFSDDLVAKNCPSDDDSSSTTPGYESSSQSPNFAGSVEGAIQFTFSPALTPMIDNIEIDEMSKVNVTNNRGSFQGKILPTFTFTGSGFAPNKFENTIMVGDASCSVTSATDTEVVCTVDTFLDGETTYKISYMHVNNGYGVINSDAVSKYSTVSFVESLSQTEGSKVGGGELMITGAGFQSPDGVAEVVFVGDDQVPRSCDITTKTHCLIVCIIPSGFEDMPGENVTAQIFVRIGSKQLPPAQSDGLEDTFEFTFKDSLTPHLDSIDDVSISGGTGSIALSGSGFGNSSIKVYLVSTLMTTARKKRSTNLHDHLSIDSVSHSGLNKRSISEFFEETMNAKKLGELSWKSAGSAKTLEPSKMARIARSDLASIPQHSGAALVFDHPYDDLDEKLSIELEEEHWMFVARHSRANLERSMMRHKRSIYNHRVFRQVESGQSVSYEGVVTSSNDTSITADFSDVPAGTYSVSVVVYGIGSAMVNSSLSSVSNQGIISSIYPSEGSVYGEQTVTITGSGFHSNINESYVSIGGNTCEVQDVTFTTITCVTSSNSGSESLNSGVTITSGDSVFPTSYYNYSLSATPTITSISPMSANAGDLIIVSGTMFSSTSTDMYVMLDDIRVNVTSSTTSTVSFEVPVTPGGRTYEVMVHNTAYGYGYNATVTLEVNFEVTSIMPIEGSKAGGSLLTITGNGFDTSGETISVTVCNQTCTIVENSISSSSLQCLTPGDTTANVDTSCDVIILQDANSLNSSTQFTYKTSLTPSILGVSPNSGGSGGGTNITITGTGFATTGNEVSIDGSVCDITTESDTQIVCLTNSHTGSGTFLVEVTVPGKGGALNDGNSTFRYVDRWSSIWTWGGLGVPLEGEFIVIETGQEIVLDVTTPKLAFLLLNGGTLKFERDANDLTLNSEYILLLNDGKLEVGTEDEPYLNQANIMLHGHVRCIELPVFGCKVLAARKGTIDLHGKPVNNTWTHLSVTAEAGATEVFTVLDVSDWEVGDEIIIPSTGDRHSLQQNEKRRIAAIGADGYSLTLDQPLGYKHLSISQTFGTEVVETRAEIGRLSR